LENQSKLNRGINGDYSCQVPYLKVSGYRTKRSFTFANEGDREAEFALGRWNYFAHNAENAKRLVAYTFPGGAFDIRMV
jgi:hypothetical protein